MKKIIVLWAFFCTCAISVNAQGTKPDKYTHVFSYFFVKPVNIDSSQVGESKTYLLEGFRRSNANSNALVPILVFLKGDKLKEILRLPWSTSITLGSIFPGMGFTANYLGKKSILSKKDLKDPEKFDQQQIETLKRDRRKEKYELRSTLPINVCGVIDKEIFVLKPCSEEKNTGPLFDPYYPSYKKNEGAVESTTPKNSPPAPPVKQKIKRPSEFLIVD